MSEELERIIASISDHGTAGQIKARHDAACLSSPIGNPRITNAQDFARVIGAFVNRQVKATGGSGYSDFEARGKAKELLVDHGRRVGQTYNNYVRNAMDGYDDGLRGVLNLLTDLLREEQANRYKEDAIDRMIDPLDFDAKVKVTGQVLAELKGLIPGGIVDPRPEAHAHEYQALLRMRAEHNDEFNDELRRH